MGGGEGTCVSRLLKTSAMLGSQKILVVVHTIARWSVDQYGSLMNTWSTPSLKTPQIFGRYGPSVLWRGLGDHRARDGPACIVQIDE